MASDLCNERKDSKWEIRDSPAKKQSDGMHEFTEREYQEHNRQMTESDGFDVMSFPRSFACGTTTPLSNFNEIADDLKAFSELALKEYNEKEHTNLEFVKVVKVNKAVVAGFLYYITFDVRDAAAVDGGTTEFQACVWDGIAHTEEATVHWVGMQIEAFIKEKAGLEVLGQGPWCGFFEEEWERSLYTKVFKGAIEVRLEAHLEVRCNKNAQMRSFLGEIEDFTKVICIWSPSQLLERLSWESHDYFETILHIVDIYSATTTQINVYERVRLLEWFVKYRIDLDALCNCIS
ncbi:hypothetical protein TEA_014801 [Camellia sinensis var. sinensis]|uniref:Cystatin domain-containing protein n=1 Tax=Camellia sinensis var. sinensis TaxID=542762 RepID=A0A4S4EHW2_CAMSN|nr:hypothetical protein TEA_014801 [Camellia sinensis var. sinensis]